jgi:hypothetical protein
MQQINILIRRNEGEPALSVEINGKVYEPVDIEIAKKLVKKAVVEAERYLIKSAARRPQ